MTRKGIGLAIVLVLIVAVIMVLRTPFLDIFGVGGESAQLNVVLITLDATRPDHLGCYGCTGAETPNLDQLAREGVLFENARAQSPRTAVGNPPCAWRQ